MGARPLRRAIQRYIEDPLADEVLRQGDMTPGSTVLVERDEAGDEEDKPLKLRIVAPAKPAKPAKAAKSELEQAEEAEPEKVGVGAKRNREGDEPSGEDGPAPEPSDPTQTEDA
jgi:ATP-dependent Clp protease ATP-binding subunit ClpC